MKARTFGQFNDEMRRQQIVQEPESPVVMPSGLFGPWRPNVPEAERRAGLRALAALVAVYCGSDHPAVGAMRKAERDPGAADEALKAFDGLPALKRRYVVSTYARLMRSGGAP
jgi:hypothetical protein